MWCGARPTARFTWSGTVAGMAQTPYAETEALLAVMSEDSDRARTLLDDMLPGERRTFARQVGALANMLAEYCDLCGEHLPAAEADNRLLMRGSRLAAHPVCADLALASRDEAGTITATREQFRAARRG